MSRSSNIQTLRLRIERDTAELQKLLDAEAESPYDREKHLYQTRSNDILFAGITSEILRGIPPSQAISEAKSKFKNKQYIFRRLRWWLVKSNREENRNYNKFFKECDIRTALDILAEASL